MNTFEKIQSIIADQLEISPDKITMETNIPADLQADSIDIMTILLGIEEELDVAIPEEKLEDLKIVKNLVEFCDNYKE